MGSTLTLIGSIVIGGTFLLGVLSFHGNVVDYTYEKTLELITQEGTSSLMRILEDDFRRLGAGVPYPATAILSLVDTTDITFLGDIDANGSVDTVRYYISAPSAAATTPNPNDVILYRQVNGVNTIDGPAGVTEFDVRVLDANGNPTANLLAVKTIHIEVRVESMYDYNNRYQLTLWEKRITPQSLVTKSNTNY